MIGERIGPYTIEAELGSGGMGTVYLASVEEGNGRKVALKIVLPLLARSARFTTRFRREGQIGMVVDHPNVVRTLDAGECDGHHFLAMEYVPGQTLKELLAELDCVPERLCRHIAREVCKGLGAIHAAGAIHRDIKPENVLITPDHGVKVMDLGVARLVEESARLSQTGAFVGSLLYSAPESFSRGGQGLDGRVDLHALGLVLYELACGASPYVADDVSGMVKQVLDEEPRRLGEVNPQLSCFFEEVVHCLLAKERDERFATAGELLAVLEAGEGSPWWAERAAALQAATRRPLRRVRIPRETAVYGREAELAKLRALFELAREGEGQVLLIEGEAGIGKSRLVDELVARLQHEDEELEFLFGSYPPGGAATAAGAFSTAYREQFGAGGSEPYLPENQILVPAFNALLRGDTTPDGAQPLTKDSLQTCFVRATQSLSAERAVIVLIDDLHFAPEEGLALFTSLALGVADHRVLLIGTTRPGVPQEWVAGLSRREQTTHLLLPRLGPKDLVRLLQDSLRSERLAKELGVQVALKSDGNPFFVFEILRGLREGQVITQSDDGSWVTTRVIEELQVPSTVLDLVNARVAELTQDERDLVDVACCWGFDFDPLLVGDVVGMRRIPLLKMLSLIERKHRLVRSAGQRFVFDHHQVQEALYQGLPELLRQEYHAALAAALETRSRAADADPATLAGATCVDLCEHFLSGARGENACRYLGAALSHLEHGYLNAQAIALASRALAVPDLITGAERVKLLVRKAGALDLLARRDEQRAALEEALPLAESLGDPGATARVRSALSALLFHTARYGEAQPLLDQTLEEARAAQDLELVARTLGNIGSVHYVHGRFEEARASYAESLSIAHDCGARHIEAANTGNLGSVFYAQGRFDEARVHLERHREIAREIGDRRGEGAAIGNLGLVLHALGHYEEGRACQERHLEIAREIGHRLGEAIAMGTLGMGFHAQGDLAATLRCHARHLALAREIGNRENEAIALGNLGQVEAEVGDLETGRGRVEQSLSLCRELGAQRPEGYQLDALGAIAVAQDDDTAAEDFYRQALDLRRRMGAAAGVMHTLGALGALCVRAGRSDEAREHLEEALGLAEDMDDAGEVVHCTAQLALLPGGDPNRAAEAFAKYESRLPPTTKMHAYFRRWEAAHDPADLAEAHCLLQHLLIHTPGEDRDSMVANVGRHSDILAAWAEHGAAE